MFLDHVFYVTVHDLFSVCLDQCQLEDLNVILTLFVNGAFDGRLCGQTSKLN